MVKWVAIGILLLPLAEIAVFGIVAGLIGFTLAFLALLAGSVAGALLLRAVARGGLPQFAGIGRNGFSQAFTAGTPLLIGAAVLLLVPGFLTDLAGLALLVGPLRRRLASFIAGREQAPAEPGVVDLAPQEWRRVPDPKIENTSGPGSSP